MPEPLDYHNPNEPIRKPNRPIDPNGPAMRHVVPVEFDYLLTQSQDLPAVNAIEMALKSESIAFFKTDDGHAVDRTAQIWVASDVKDRAGEIAVGVFLRRKKIKTYPEKQSTDRATLSDGSFPDDLLKM